MNSRKIIKENTTIKPLKSLYKKLPHFEPKIFNLKKKASSIKIYSKKSQTIPHCFNTQIEKLWVNRSMPNVTLKISGKAVPISENLQELNFSKPTHFKSKNSLDKTNYSIIDESHHDPNCSHALFSPWPSLNHSITYF